MTHVKDELDININVLCCAYYGKVKKGAFMGMTHANIKMEMKVLKNFLIPLKVKKIKV
jgi:hypothetical protein